MPTIDIRIRNLGMSGAHWLKTGAFTHPAQATVFLLYWWEHLSCPDTWEMTIDGLDYSIVPVFPKETSEAHIHYCFELHRAFYHGVEKECQV